MSKFHDEFLNKGSPEHDKLMIQCTLEKGINHIFNLVDIKPYMEHIIKDSIHRQEKLDWNDRVIKETNLLSYDAPIILTSYETEVITRNGTFIIGYADAVIKANLTGSMRTTDPDIIKYECILYILVEAKPTINSIGEVIRQLKTYKSILCPYELMLPVIVTYTQLDADSLTYLKNEGIRVVVFPRS